MKLLNILNGTLIVEVSESLKKKLLDKFKLETQDTEKDILEYIESFEKYQRSLPADQRDITRYDFKTLKSLIDSIENGKTRKADVNSAITSIIKKTQEKKEVFSLLELQLAVKKFFEIQSEIKDANKDINKFSYLKLIQFLEKNYEDLLTQKLLNKFKPENQILTNEQILSYISEYIENFNDIPFDTPGADLMSFTQFEHLIDAMIAKRGLGKKTKTELGDISLIYDDGEDFKIYAPTGKEHCIKLAHGRTWCIGWLGGRNLYYNYRIGNHRTIYYVIDESLDYEDRYFASVILVDPRGGTSFADKTNSRPFDGSVNLPWDEISGFIPKLTNLKNLFVSRPLSEDEIEMRDRYQNIEYSKSYNTRLPNNQTPMEYFDSPEKIAQWMEIKGPELFDEDYASLPQDLKKKYIALGFELTPGQIAVSEGSVLTYYANRKIDNIRQSTLNKLSDGDIALLNSPIFKQLKQELKPRFSQGLSRNSDPNEFEVRDFGRNSEVGKFLKLYSLEDFIGFINPNVESISIDAKDSDVKIKIPRAIVEFKNLGSLILINGVIDEIPDYICELKNLQYIGFQNNPGLTRLPECIGDLPSLDVLNLEGSDNVVVPESIKSRFSNSLGGHGIWM